MRLTVALSVTLFLTIYIIKNKSETGSRAKIKKLIKISNIIIFFHSIFSYLVKRRLQVRVSEEILYTYWRRSGFAVLYEKEEDSEAGTCRPTAAPPTLPPLDYCRHSTHPLSRCTRRPRQLYGKHGYRQVYGTQRLGNPLETTRKETSEEHWGTRVSDYLKGQFIDGSKWTFYFESLQVHSGIN